jgi:hypothetical protein
MTFCRHRKEAIRMLSTPPPKSNLERQRAFRARNPGYFKRYRSSETKEQVRARIAVVVAAVQAEEQAKAAAEHQQPRMWYASA